MSASAPKERRGQPTTNNDIIAVNNRITTSSYIIRIADAHRRAGPQDQIVIEQLLEDSLLVLKKLKAKPPALPPSIKRRTPSLLPADVHRKGSEHLRSGFLYRRSHNTDSIPRHQDATIRPEETHRKREYAKFATDNNNHAGNASTLWSDNTAGIAEHKYTTKRGRKTAQSDVSLQENTICSSAERGRNLSSALESQPLPPSINVLNERRQDGVSQPTTLISQNSGPETLTPTGQSSVIGTEERGAENSKEDKTSGDTQAPILDSRTIRREMESEVAEPPADSTHSGMSSSPALNDKSTASKSRKYELVRIKVNVSSDLDLHTLEAARNKFYQTLLETSVMIRFRNQPISRSFSVKDATELSNFFFDEMLGLSALKRLRQLVREYNAPSEDGIGSHQLARAEQASLDPQEPQVLRDFFDAFQQEQRTRVYVGSSVATVNSYVLSLNTRKRFDVLLEQADEREPGLMAAFEKRGFATKPGVGYKSIVRTYLCDVLGIDGDTLTKSTEPSNVLATLVSTFGIGILTLIPYSFITRVRTWGYAKVVKAIELLSDLQPLLRPFASLLEELVYVPISKGEEIRIEPTLLVSKGSIMHSLEKAKTQICQQ